MANETENKNAPKKFSQLAERFNKSFKNASKKFSQLAERFNKSFKKALQIFSGNKSQDRAKSNNRNPAPAAMTSPDQNKEAIRVGAPKNVMEEFITSIIAGNDKKMNELLQNNPVVKKNINSNKTFNHRPIYYAVLKKNTEAIKALLKAGADHTREPLKGENANKMIEDALAQIAAPSTQTTIAPAPVAQNAGSISENQQFYTTTPAPKTYTVPQAEQSAMQKAQWTIPQPQSSKLQARPQTSVITDVSAPTPQRATITPAPDAQVAPPQQQPSITRPNEKNYAKQLQTATPSSPINAGAIPKNQQFYTTTPAPKTYTVPQAEQSAMQKAQGTMSVANVSGLRQTATKIVDAPIIGVQPQSYTVPQPQSSKLQARPQTSVITDVSAPTPQRATITPAPDAQVAPQQQPSITRPNEKNYAKQLQTATPSSPINAGSIPEGVTLAAKNSRDIRNSLQTAHAPQFSKVSHPVSPVVQHRKPSGMER